MKPLTPPSLRERRRYIVFEIIYEEHRKKHEKHEKKNQESEKERERKNREEKAEKEEIKEKKETKEEKKKVKKEREEEGEEKEEREEREEEKEEKSKIKDEEGISERALLRAIWDALYSLYGDIGVSECGIWLIDYDEKRGVGILRCTHTKVEAVRAALACIHMINGRRTCIRGVVTSGTIKAARRRSTRIKPFRFRS